MAKLQIFIFIIFLISLSYQKVDNSSSERVNFTPSDLEGFFVNFAKSAKIELVSKSTMPCSKSVKQFILDGSDAINELLSDQTWTGTISVAEVLGGSSYVARNCTYSIDELSGQLYNYLEAFPTFESWMRMVKENVSRNMVQLSLLSMQIVDEIKKANPDFPLLGSMVGELVYYTLERETVQNTLRYLRQDPLAPSPMNKYVWYGLESAYEFLKNSQILEQTRLNQ